MEHLFGFVRNIFNEFKYFKVRLKNHAAPSILQSFFLPVFLPYCLIVFFNS